MAHCSCSKLTRKCSRRSHLEQQIYSKLVGGWGCSLDSTGVAYSAPQTPSWWGLPKNCTPASAFWPQAVAVQALRNALSNYARTFRHPPALLIECIFAGTGSGAGGRSTCCRVRHCAELDSTVEVRCETRSSAVYLQCAHSSHRQLHSQFVNFLTIRDLYTATQGLLTARLTKRK